MSFPVRILIAGQVLTAEGLSQILKEQFTIADVALNQEQAIQLAVSLEPDILLVEPEFRATDWIEMLSRIRLLAPTVRVVWILQEAHRPTQVRALRHGVAGLVLNQQASRELCDAIRFVVKGGTYVAPQLRDDLAELRGAKPVKSDGRAVSLTVRQQEVLQLLAEGRTNKEIGYTMQISKKTVEFHRASLMEELGLYTIAELSRFAMQHGFVGPLA